MDESEQREILNRYRKALESIIRTDPALPDVPVFRGTLLVRADGTEYHYNDEWCKAEDIKKLAAIVQSYRDAEFSSPIPGDLTEPDEMYITVRASAARLQRFKLIALRCFADTLTKACDGICEGMTVLSKLNPG